MRAKPPLACHANLVAEWGGDGWGAGGSRELGSGVGGVDSGAVGAVRRGVGGADESIMCIQVRRRPNSESRSR